MIDQPWIIIARLGGVFATARSARKGQPFWRCGLIDEDLGSLLKLTCRP